MNSGKMSSGVPRVSRRPGATLPIGNNRPGLLRWLSGMVQCEPYGWPRRRGCRVHFTRSALYSQIPIFGCARKHPRPNLRRPHRHITPLAASLPQRNDWSKPACWRGLASSRKADGEFRSPSTCPPQPQRGGRSTSRRGEWRRIRYARSACLDRSFFKRLFGAESSGS